MPGKKTDSDRKDKQVAIRFTDGEYEIVKLATDLDGRSVSEYVRRIAVSVAFMELALDNEAAIPESVKDDIMLYSVIKTTLNRLGTRIHEMAVQGLTEIDKSILEKIGVPAPDNKAAKKGSKK